MTYVEPIFQKLGGARKIAKGLGYPESTVRSWLVRGSIPDPEKPRVLAMALAINVPMAAEDFFPDQDMIRAGREDCPPPPPEEDAA